MPDKFLPGFMICKPLSKAPMTYSEGRVEQMFNDEEVNDELFYELPEVVASKLSYAGQKVDLNHDTSRTVGEITQDVYSPNTHNLWLKLRLYNNDLGREALKLVTSEGYGSVSLTTRENAQFDESGKVEAHNVKCAGIAIVPTGMGARNDTFMLTKNELVDLVPDAAGSSVDELIEPALPQPKYDGFVEVKTYAPAASRDANAMKHPTCERIRKFRMVTIVVKGAQDMSAPPHLLLRRKQHRLFQPLRLRLQLRPRLQLPKQILRLLLPQTRRRSRRKTTRKNSQFLGMRRRQMERRTNQSTRTWTLRQ